MNVLGGFDGISCGQIALGKAGVLYEKYFASEIDKDAIRITQHNYPDTVQLGNISLINTNDLPKIDLFIGGSPCQSFSNLGDGSGFDGKSKLFFEYVRVLNELRVKNKNIFFMLENVFMKKEWENKISKILGVRPIRLDAVLFNPNSRKRLYWTNIPVNTYPPPAPYKSINEFLIDEHLINDKYYQSESWVRWFNQREESLIGKGFVKINPHIASCFTSRMYANWKGNFINKGRGIRRLTPVECERLCGIPDNYTDIVIDSKRYKAIGNGWNTNAVSYIFDHLPKA